MPIGLIALATFLCGAGVAHACDPKTTGPIIDVHLHLFPDGDRMLSGRPNPFTHVAAPVRSSAAHLEATLEAMRRCGVVRGVASGDLEVINRAQAGSRGQLLGGYRVSVPSPADLEAIRREAAARRIVMIGEVGSQYQGIKPDDARMEPLWRIAEELDLPVGLHMGPGGEGVGYARAVGYRMADSDALLLEPVLLRHPKMRIFVMHAGWPLGDQMMGLLYAHPQVYVDISATDWITPKAEFHSYLRRLVEAGYGKRILYGSDQMAWPEEIAASIDAVQDADFLTPEQKRDIFYNNAMTFFRWTEPHGR